MSAQKQTNNNQQKAKISKDKAKLNNFYNFKVSTEKFDTIKVKMKGSLRRNFILSMLFGFVTQYILGNSVLYENIVRKTTMRRLKAKMKQQEALQNKIRLKMQKEKQAAQQKVL